MKLPVVAPALAALLMLLPGCLGEPEIQERWTLLEILDAGPTDLAAYSVGAAATPVTVRARITYRELLTGFLVADLRACPAVTTDDTRLDRDDDPLAVARDVDFVLQNSVSVGADAVPVTGWDHLIQELDITFDGGLLAATAADSSVASAGTGVVAASGLFLLLYFSDDVEEVELRSGEEIEVITPTFSTQRDILSAGIEILPQP
jgi:hypothetical protein